MGDHYNDLTRRGFLGTVAAGGATLAGAHLGCGKRRERESEPAPEIPATPSGADAAAPPGGDLAAMSAAELSAGMAAGRFTARELTAALLDRIEAMDHRGPALHAMIAVNPDALADAERLDGERRAGRLRGPLHGLPLVIKDNLDTGDRMATTAGSLALAGSRASRDAGVVARLRAAGCVILGKTNLSEWANIRSARSISGWSAVGGQCVNPYVLDRNPCGSSSGTGAAVAAGYAPLGIGTETDGSIVCPSHACGLVGVKPTVGLASRAGIVPISHSQDTPGPMCRTVADAAALLSAIAGTDPADAATAEADLRRADYARALDPGALRGARIGVLRKAMGFHPAADALVDEAIRAVREAGATVIDPVVMPGLRSYEEAELTVLLHELKVDLAGYLAGRPAAPVRSLTDVIAFNRAHAAEELRWFGQELFEQAEATTGLTAPAYQAALAACRRGARDRGIDAVVAEHRVDAVIAPTGAPAWVCDPINGDHFLGASSSPAAVAGYPNITVPMGFVGPLPVGLSFFGPAWSEARLLAIAFAFEQATGHRKPPRFLARI